MPTFARGWPAVLPLLFSLRAVRGATLFLHGDGASQIEFEATGTAKIIGDQRSINATVDLVVGHQAPSVVGHQAPSAAVEIRATGDVTCTGNLTAADLILADSGVSVQQMLERIIQLEGQMQMLIGPPASPPTPPPLSPPSLPRCAAATLQTTTFSARPHGVTWVVPPCASAITMTMWGAGGHSGSAGTGGGGGYARGIKYFAEAQEGSVLTIAVGKAGTQGTAVSFPGGGCQHGTGVGGGGGGFSGVFSGGSGALDNQTAALIIAGGGGGGAYGGGQGGQGGGSSGANGQGANGGGCTSGGGGQSAGGSGGIGADGAALEGGAANHGNAGAGGGGYWGGQGGVATSCDGAGGGGSGYVGGMDAGGAMAGGDARTANAAEASHAFIAAAGGGVGEASAEGLVVFEYMAAPPPPPAGQTARYVKFAPAAVTGGHMPRSSGMRVLDSNLNVLWDVASTADYSTEPAACKASIDGSIAANGHVACNDVGFTLTNVECDSIVVDLGATPTAHMYVEFDSVYSGHRGRVFDVYTSNDGTSFANTATFDYHTNVADAADGDPLTGCVGGYCLGGQPSGTTCGTNQGGADGGIKKCGIWRYRIDGGPFVPPSPPASPPSLPPPPAYGMRVRVQGSGRWSGVCPDNSVPGGCDPNECCGQYTNSVRECTQSGGCERMAAGGWSWAQAFCNFDLTNLQVRAETHHGNDQGCKHQTSYGDWGTSSSTGCGYVSASCTILEIILEAP